MEKLCRGKWLLVNVKGREQGPKGSPNVRAPKNAFKLELLCFYTSWKP